MKVVPVGDDAAAHSRGAAEDSTGLDGQAAGACISPLGACGTISRSECSEEWGLRKDYRHCVTLEHITHC